MGKARNKKSKRGTMRKPRGFQLTENNFANNNNFNEETDLNLAELRAPMERRILINKALNEFREVPPGTFIIRINKKTYEEPRKLLEIMHDFRLMRYKHLRPLEIVYIGNGMWDSYYVTINYKLKSEFTEEEELQLNDLQSPGSVVGLWEVIRQEPLNFFAGFPIYEDEEPLIDIYVDPNHAKAIQEKIARLPYFLKKLYKYANAFYTAPAKLTNLRLRGLEGAIRRFETRRKRNVPRDIQNIIEEHIMGRPHAAAYIEGRDNLARISTNLFM